MHIKFSVILLLFSLANFSFGQTGEDSTAVNKGVYKIVKNDGTEYIGQIISDDGREVLIETEALGKIYIPKSDIKLIKLIAEEFVDASKYREVGPFISRYYLTNNALPIKKGENYAMLHLYGPEVHFAVSDKLSIGVMATWAASPIGIALKRSFKTKNENINLSVGTIMFNSGYLYTFRGWGGLHWGSVTIGKPGYNVTFSSGFGYVDLVENNRSRFGTGLDKLNRGSVSSIAALIPAGKKASFIFDSMISISEDRRYSYFTSYSGGQPNIQTYVSGTQITGLIMPGMRFQHKENRAFQVALAGVIRYSSTFDDFLSFPVPMCSWFFKF